MASPWYVQCKCMYIPHPGSDHNLTQQDRTNCSSILELLLNLVSCFFNMYMYKIQGYIPSKEDKLSTKLLVTFVDVHTVPMLYSICTRQCVQKHTQYLFYALGSVSKTHNTYILCARQCVQKHTVPIPCSGQGVQKHTVPILCFGLCVQKHTVSLLCSGLCVQKRIAIDSQAIISYFHTLGLAQGVQLLNNTKSMY